jgi:hypothetical protein
VRIEIEHRSGAKTDVTREVEGIEPQTPDALEDAVCDIVYEAAADEAGLEHDGDPLVRVLWDGIEWMLIKDNVTEVFNTRVMVLAPIQEFKRQRPHYQFPSEIRHLLRQIEDAVSIDDEIMETYRERQHKRLDDARAAAQDDPRGERDR